MLSRTFIFTVLLAPHPVLLADELDDLVGSWVYQASNTMERLEFVRDGEELQGIYFGIDFGGESSPYFTATIVGSLALEKSGPLSFTIPPRKLFAERPKSFEEAETIQGYGFTRSEMSMTGHVDGGVLSLECRSTQGVCHARQMSFYRQEQQ